LKNGFIFSLKKILDKKRSIYFYLKKNHIYKSEKSSGNSSKPFTQSPIISEELPEFQKI
jgi:hypothetical protein